MDKKPDSKKPSTFINARELDSWDPSPSGVEVLLLTVEASELFGKVNVSEHNRISKIYISARGL